MKPDMTQEQIKNWLLSKWKTPRGRVRADNPFGPVELKMLENFERGEAVAGEPDNYVVYDKEGNYFRYTYILGKLKLIDMGFR